MHIKMTGHKHYKCDECDRTFSQSGNRDRHIVVVHNGQKPPKSKKCNSCDKKFRSRSDLKRHIYTVHNGIRHNCSICGISFSQKYDLRKHIAQVHDGDSDKVRHEVKKLQEDFRCGFCGEGFNQEKSLNLHMNQVHENQTTLEFRISVAPGKFGKNNKRSPP